MAVKERIAQLRELMEKNGIDVYMVPTADFHNSEYVGEHFKARAFMSGFTGSAGTLVVTK
ncbi:MAG: aminopeptidase P family N-terminal domain-containing protein, partial [Gemella haemolysans]|nr:aminopeptidase P family N-terminal domain-containing protein [Gemella haemolysans]